MMKRVSKICINCPAGCHLEIAVGEDGAIRTSGNQCPRGEKYAVQELTDPRRIVTAVVCARGDDSCRIPVRTLEPVPKALIPELLKTLFALQIDLPVKRGDVVLKDYQGRGIDIAATRTFAPFKQKN